MQTALARGETNGDGRRVAGETILLVDDDTALRELIGGFLRDHGFRVFEAADVPALRSALAREHPQLILLDVMMPGEDGLVALRGLPETGRPAIIMLSALGSDTDRIVGLELGADDYLAKPCNPRELLARVRAVLRREARTEAGCPVAFSGWRLDPGKFILVAPDGQRVDLTTGEFRLLQALVAARGAVLDRERLLRQLGVDKLDNFDRAIDIAVSRLRRKLSRHEGGEELIRTVRGEGYALNALPDGG